MLLRQGLARDRGSPANTSFPEQGWSPAARGARPPRGNWAGRRHSTPGSQPWPLRLPPVRQLCCGMKAGKPITSGCRCNKCCSTTPDNAGSKPDVVNPTALFESPLRTIAVAWSTQTRAMSATAGLRTTPNTVRPRVGEGCANSTRRSQSRPHAQLASSRWTAPPVRPSLSFRQGQNSYDIRHDQSLVLFSNLPV